jgi:hypothetical protein
LRAIVVVTGGIAITAVIADTTAGLGNLVTARARPAP